MNNNVENPCINRVSWNAIFAGVFVALGLSFLFQVLTMGIGLSLFTYDEAGAATLAIGTFVWLFIGSYIILFVGGFVAGKLLNTPIITRCAGFMHGFVVWTIALIITLLIAFQITQSTPVALVNVGTPSFLGMQSSPSRAVQPQRERTSSSNEVVVTPTQQNVNKVGLATLASFLLLLSAAVGAGVGGYCGVKSTRCHPTQYNVNP